MANLLTNVVYVTADDVRDTTTITSLQTEVDAVIEPLIVQAQYVIDAYICSYGIKFDSTQEFIFPVNVDEAAVIPNDLKIATVYVVEQLYLEGDVTFESGDSVVVEEKSGPDSVKFSDAQQNAQKYITSKVESLLRKYKSSFIKQVL